ncbi:MAG: fused response regulator/phosphatase [Oceanicoccus sp.]
METPVLVSELSVADGLSVSTAKILIADDSNTDRLLLKTILIKQGHEVVVASDGHEAIEVFREARPDVVLLDALMPKMDGFEAAEKIRQLAGEVFVPIIFLTSLQSTDSLVRCLDAGGDDFLPKPYNSVILQAKLTAFIRMAEMHRTMQSQRDLIVAHNDRLLREQEIAKRVFDKVAHSGCLDADNIQYSLSPIAIFNGDVALAGVSPSGNLMVLLGDFTGHGLDAAIGAMPLAQTFYSMLEKGFSLQDILREINEKLHDILPIDVFCCAVVADIDFNNSVMQVWNGGLPDCVLYRALDSTVIPLKSQHIPFGIRDSDSFDDSVDTFEIQVDDRLFLWSDGIHEATNSDSEMFGEERLFGVFEENTKPEQLFDEINEALADFLSDKTISDDVSIVEVRAVSPGDFRTSQSGFIGSKQAGPRDWTLKYELRPETLSNFDPLPMLLHILIQVPYLRNFGGQIFTVLTELYTNALEHGVLQLDSSLKDSPVGFDEYYQLREQRLLQLQEGAIEIQFHYKGTDNGGNLKIIIEDSGDGFNYKQFDGDLHNNVRYSGRGINLLRSICDSIEYSGRGNIVRASFLWGDSQ